MNAPETVLIPLTAMLCFAALVAGGALFAGRFLGPRNLKGAKIEPYECGVPAVGNPRDKISVKYYLVAMLFLLFDLEVAFLIPVAIAWEELRALGFIALGLTGFFLFYFLLGIWYEFKVKALDWDMS
jgi:NADH-quinone oxidoreductase subunit A